MQIIKIKSHFKNEFESFGCFNRYDPRGERIANERELLNLAEFILILEFI